MGRWLTHVARRRSVWHQRLARSTAISRDEQVLKSWSLFSSVASTSAGIELMHNVVIVLGNSNTSASPFVIGHGVMRDAIDAAAVIATLGSVGLCLGDIADPAGRNRLVNIFAKTEASP